MGCPLRSRAKNILPEKKLSDAEKGLEKITFNQLVGLADRYHLPITYFYLENPFKSELVENFRTLNAQPISITPRLREILMELNEKRDLVIEYQTYDKEYDYSYVKSVSLQKDPEEVGENISMLFDFMIREKHWDSEYNALNGWINTLTKIGILIFQVSRIDSKIMSRMFIVEYPISNNNNQSIGNDLQQDLLLTS